MITQAEFFGGSEESNPGATRTLKVTSGRVQLVDPSAGIDVVLPDARLVKLGGPTFYVIHVGVGNNIALKDADGNLLLNIGTGFGCVVGLARGDSLAGKWAVRWGALGMA